MSEDYEMLRGKLRREPIVVPFDQMCRRIDSLNNNAVNEFHCVLVAESHDMRRRGAIAHAPKDLVIKSKIRRSLLNLDPIAENIKKEAFLLDMEFDIYTLRVMKRNWANGKLTAVPSSSCAFVMSPEGLVLVDFLDESLNERQISTYQRFLNEILMVSDAYERV
jgi:hypothetical protein